MVWIGYRAAYIDGIEHQLLRWLVRGYYNEVPVGIRMVAARMYPFSLLAIRKKVCPFCGRRFNTQNGIIAHLRRGKRCAVSYSNMVENILVRFREVKEEAEKEVFRQFKANGKKPHRAKIYARLVLDIRSEELYI